MPFMVEEQGLVAPMVAERKAPWDFLHGVKDVSGSRDLDEVMVRGGLNWPVVQRRVFFSMNDQLFDTGKVVNVRADNGAQLGFVSAGYSLVQNREAFDLLEYVSGSSLSVERAGSFGGGRIAFIEAKRPDDMVILGDRVSRYVLFVNTFDGSGSLRVVLTNIRVICKNTLTAALKGADRYVSFLHRGNVAEKIEDARRVLVASAEYDEVFARDAEALSKIRISREGVNRVLDAVFPMDADPVSQKRKLDNIVRIRDNFVECLNAPDLYDHRSSAWGVYNAFADLAFHGGTVVRQTARTSERPMVEAVNGSPLLDKVHAMLLEQSVA